MLQISASAVVPAPPADVLELLCGTTAWYSEWVTCTDAVTRGQVDRDSRCTVEAVAQLATRELGEQARA